MLPEDLDETTRPNQLRLFPIGGLVMFPGLVQGLHVFEPRYRALTAACLEESGMFALPIPIAAGSNDRPELFPVACAVRIVRHHRLPDGRYDLTVVGLQRVRLVKELDEVDGYRIAEVEWLEESHPQDAVHIAWVRRELLDMFRRLLAHSSSQAAEVTRQLERAATLAVLVDLISFVIPFPLAWKLELLEELDVLHRARKLLVFHSRLAKEAGETTEVEPAVPGFSVN